MLDSITWGNPLQIHLPYLEESTPLDKHIAQLTKFSFPKNSSKATREELNLLVDFTNELAKNEDYLKRYRNYDFSLERTIAQFIKENQLGEEAAKIADDLIKETIPLLVKLKFFFQRPRPYQLAQYYKLKLFPFDSRSANSPSYPAGHTLQSRLICYVLGNHYPELFDHFDSLANDIKYSREYMGLHYPSDSDFAMYCFEVITSDKEFKARYQL
jgi:acid phosphatase (class A)